MQTKTNQNRIPFQGSFLLLFVFAFYLNFSCVIAQPKWKLVIEGVITENDKPLLGAKVTSFIKGEEQEDVYTNSEGVFKINLNANTEYIVKITKLGGYITKVLSFDTRNVPKSEDNISSFNLSFDAALFKEFTGFDKSLLQTPFGKVKYDENKKQFSEDIIYTINAQHKIDEALKAIELAKTLKEEFNKLIQLADRLIANEKIEEALIELKKASDLNIDNALANIKTNEANQLLNTKNLTDADKRRKKDFDRLINYGSMHASNGNLNAAEDCFKKAAALQVDSVRVNSLLNELSYQLALEEEKNRIKLEAEVRRIAFLEKAKSEREAARLELIQRLEERNSPLAEPARAKFEKDQQINKTK
jgi:tetratricopeptide (TPR) repeat protein